MEEKVKKPNRPDSSSMTNNRGQNNNNNNSSNRKPEMARYQPPGNRNTSDKPPTPPLVNKNRFQQQLKQQQQQQKQQQQPQRQVEIKKVVDFKNEDLDYTRKTPGSLNEDNNQSNKGGGGGAEALSSQIETNIKIPINIIKTNNYKGGGGGGGGILKLDSATLNQMNNSIKKTESNHNNNIYLESSNSYNNNNNNNSSSNRNKDHNLQENSNVKMLFDPNNPDKPIYVKEKLANKVSNSYQRTRNETKNRSDEIINNDTSEMNSGNTNSSGGGGGINNGATSSKPVNQDIIKAQNIIELIKPLEQNLSNLIESIDLTKQTIQEFNLNIMPIRKKLEQLCIDATFSHIETASFANIDLNHWRSCYHQLIETLRKELNSINNNNNNTSLDPKQQKLHNLVSIELKNYIQDGNRFYTKFVEKLEEYFLKFKSDDLAALNYVNNCDSIRIACHTDMTIKTKNMKLALMCINRCWIAMGDLSRYEELIFATTSASITSLTISNNNSIGSSPASSNCSSIDSISFKNNTTIQRDYSVARYHYLKAKAIAPKSSRAYHQLAILAVYTRRRLDACYYYFRCLEVNIPLTSVKQALNSIFDEARVKSDAIAKFINNAIALNKQKNANKTENRSFNNSESSSSSSSSSLSHRIETWYLPSIFTNTNESAGTNDNISSNNNSDNDSVETDNDSDTDTSDDDDEDTNDTNNNDNEHENDEQNDKKLSTFELNKRFMHNYLNTIGKLFTKVGMESYCEVCSRMLFEFKELLRRRPCPLQRIRLLQITVINISVIDLLFKMQETQNKQKLNQHQQANFIQRNQLVENAVQLGIDMFVLISKRFTHLLSSEENINNTDPSDYEKTWRQFFPSIKIFIDWMLCNSKLWQPFPDQLPPDLGPILNRWQIICDMLNLVYKLLNNTNNNSNQLQQLEMISGKIKLDEDLELVGFVPLLSLPCEFDPKVDKTIDLSYLTEMHLMQIRDKKRMEKLCLFADYLCGLEQPYLKYDVVNKCYCPVIISNTKINLNSNKQIVNKRHNLLSINNNDRTSVCSNNSSTSSFKSNEIEYLSNNFDSIITLHTDNTESNEINDEIQEGEDQFSQLKEKHRLLLKEKRIEQEKLVNHLQHQRRIELEIRPKFVVADTNCFVDHLNLIEKILTTNYYILVVPLLVINELDKLSKSISNYNDDSLEHAQYVQRSAKKAIQFLNDKFDKRDRNIKAITSQGSVLETIQFRSEELKAKGTNDELILGCCLHFVHDNARDFNKSDRIHLYREIVLLTEDRHLRLKSHTRNVPVKNILHFCRWSHLLVNENNTNNKNTSSINNNRNRNFMYKNKKKNKNGKNNFKQKNKDSK